MSKLSFKMKVMLMIGTALTALLIMAILSLLQERRLIIDSRRDLLTTAVQSAHSIVTGTYSILKSVPITGIEIPALLALVWRTRVSAALGALLPYLKEAFG